MTFGRRDRDKPAISQAQQLLNEDSKDEETGTDISSLFPEDEWIYQKPLQCLNISILREYLAHEFNCLQTLLRSLTFDLERIIDDFVFMCFFVGNDFLPHLPSLDIRDGAIDFLIQVYKEILPTMTEYLTSPGGGVNLRNVGAM